MRRRWRRLLSAAGLFLALLLLPWVYLSLVTILDRYDRGDGHLPSAPAAIVLGAGLAPDGSPSPFLAARLDIAVQLYRTGHVQHLLMTGDNSRTNYDEVGAMHRYVVAHGVPDGVVTEDHAGFTTYDSCYRARAIFGIRKAIVVSQDYHLPRAVYTCRELGIDAVGVGMSEWGQHPGDMVLSQAREMLADVKALWQVHVARPKPHFLGPHETLH